MTTDCKKPIGRGRVKPVASGVNPFVRFDAAPDLYAATDWVDKIKGFTSCYEYVPISAVKDYEKFQITLTGAQISALIGARRKARGE